MIEAPRRLIEIRVVDPVAIIDDLQTALLVEGVDCVGAMPSRFFISRRMLRWGRAPAGAASR